jgi:hypothetical protein
MAEQKDHKSLPNYDIKQENGEEKIKIICLGDSAVGKSKYVDICLFKRYRCSLSDLTYTSHDMQLRFVFSLLVVEPI